MKQIQSNMCFDGEQRMYQWSSNTLNNEAKFSVYLPPKALHGQVCMALFFLAGLTCNEETFAIKAHAQKIASTLGIILIMPDTSPRGDGVADDEDWDLGQGAGFYINATQTPWSEHFQMERYIVDELYEHVVKNFPINRQKIGIMGHSMGGHGALTLAWKYPEKFKTVSAFAPICAPTQCDWGQKAFQAYLGDESTGDWSAHDTVALIQQKGALFDEVLIDQGENDQFYSQLNPHLLKQVCQKVGQRLMLREHAGYDHSYYFIQSFIADHLRFHSKS
ncbi:S-formylglutathione hydrolase [Acinetobacter boissieri]|uniref:S-formylglutathione hydrolase n=1 Tax=Acinetobacter boissieri TaxID=1219383 RepID=A0A1G6J4H2_9GAMM|nr:S-formylglutathione hydrolase [Acinetobacter boissieri]SDC13698.1 S-formylglutathione hydrolase [Acinetobacter boissieri]